MTGKILVYWSIAILLFFTGCTEPKYLKNPNSVPPDQKLLSEADCMVQIKTSNICLYWYWEKKPTDQNPGQIIFKSFRLNRFDQTPIELDLEAIPEVVLWMPSMGHGSTPTAVERLDIGTFRAKDVFFIMPGDWDIQFQIKTEGEITDEAIVSIFI